MPRAARWATRAFTCFVLGLAVYLAAVSVSINLCCADDSSFAVVSKNLAQGRGYTQTLGYHSVGPRPRLFDPLVGTGPTSNLPVALAIAAFGPSPYVPGLTHVAMNVLLVALIWLVLVRTLGRALAFAATALFVVVALVVTSFHIEQWAAHLGELPAALLIVLAHALFMAGSARPALLGLAGVAFGAAVLAKALSIVYALAFFCVAGTWIALRLASRKDARSQVREALFVALGFALPIAAFECWKLVSLGSVGAYRANWQEYLVVIGLLGTGGTVHSALATLAARAATLQARFFAPWWVWSLSFLAAAGTAIRLQPPRTRVAVGSLLAGVALQSSYWLFVSNGLERYVLIAVVVFVFVLALLAAVAGAWWARAICIAGVLAYLWYAAPAARYQANLASRATLCPSGTLAAALGAVAYLDRHAGGGPVMTEWWAHVAPLEYLTAYPGRFTRLGGTAEPPRFAVVDERFLIGSDARFVAYLGSCGAVVFDQKPYRIYACE